MKKTRFKIPIFGYTITILYIEGVEDSDKACFELRKIKVLDDELTSLKKEIEDDLKNGGYHYWNEGRKNSLIVVFKHKTESGKINTIAHEIRHVVDRMMQIYGITDIETPAYIQGYIFEKIFKQ